MNFFVQKFVRIDKKTSFDAIYETIAFQSDVEDHNYFFIGPTRSVRFFSLRLIFLISFKNNVCASLANN